MSEPRKSQKAPAPCACVKDPFALFPPGMRPHKRKKSNLRR